MSFRERIAKPMTAHSSYPIETMANPAEDNLIYKVTNLVAHIVLGTRYRIAVDGRHHLPIHEAFLLLPKHQRWQDVPLLALAVPSFMTFVAKQELFTKAINRFIITRLGGIPLNRKRPMESRRTLHVIRAQLRQKRALVVFPEGTYYPGVMGPGNLGMLRFIVSAAKVPLIPVGIRYEKHWLKPRVWIRFGAPIRPSDTTSAQILLAEVMARIAELSGLA